MNTDINGSARAARVIYTQYDWGDHIEGTKDQLQALGLGVGRAFPGEPRANRREISVRDPRGYIAKVSKDRNRAGVYSASIHFTNRPEYPVPPWRPAFPGVSVRDGVCSDEYLGSAHDLAAAGLVRLDQLPGQPGMKKARVLIFADGKVFSGPNSLRDPRKTEPGARWVEPASPTSYLVGVLVTTQECERRRAAQKANEEHWRQRVRALPRPPKLQPMPPSKWLALEVACISAKRDTHFQGMLARIVAAADQPPA